jgi:hypothetical protein
LCMKTKDIFGAIELKKKKTEKKEEKEKGQ